MCSTRVGAPPCSGPDIAPIAPESAAATSAPVEAMTRAVNVDAFIPCSAADTQYASSAFTWCGSGSPRQLQHEPLDRSCVPFSTSLRRHRLLVAARGLRDVRQRGHRGLGQVVASLVVVDVEQLA